MEKKIVVYKKRFLNKLDRLLLYLEKEWNHKVGVDFIGTLQKKIQLIKAHS